MSDWETRKCQCGLLVRKRRGKGGVRDDTCCYEFEFGVMSSNLNLNSKSLAGS